MKKWLFVLAAVMLIPGCSWIKSWGHGKVKPGDPHELVEFEPTLQVKEIWSADAGKGLGRGAPQLRPAYHDGALYVADYKGRLSAFDAENGDRRWQLKTKLPFSGGPGVDTDKVLIGTENGEVHAFDAKDGAALWTAGVSSEILAAPVEADGIVVVRSIDGRIFGLNALNGNRLWIYDHSVPLLTLRGNSVPLVRAGVVYIGYDSGEVVALKLADGSLIWQQVVASPDGRTELDRLTDIDGQMMYVASDLLVSSYKDRVVSLAADSGRLLWFKEIPSASGVVVNRVNLVVSDKDGFVWLLDRRNGATQWKQDQLENRGLTRPSIYGSFVVVGDFEGYLHWINLDDGKFAARSKVGGKGFTGPPLVVGNTLYVQTRKGKLVAFRAGAAIASD